MQLFSKEKKGNKRILNILGFKIKYSVKGKKKKINKKIRKNVFKTKYSDKVLISYLTRPFRRGIRHAHTNELECYSAAEIFNELGYRVDVINWDDSVDDSDLSEYKIVYGSGGALNKSSKINNITSIFYGTGCSPLYTNKLTIEKVNDFYKKTGVLAASSSRCWELDYHNTVYFSDLIIALGNKFVSDTYKINGVEQDIKNLNCFFYDTYDIDIEKKDFDKVKNNFVWFGSSGLLHKGLDIAIEIFKKRKDLNLFICGAYEHEKEFFSYYENELNNKIPNIKNLGFIDIKSDDFKKLMDNSIAIISPSVSEGGAPAVVTVMANGGLIPVISKSSGIDVEKYGFVFEQITEDSVEEKINKLLNCSVKELKELSGKIKQETREIYNYENYKQNLKNIITKRARKSKCEAILISSE